MKYIIYITISLILTSCSTVKYRVIHKTLTIPTQCNFDKFTEEEKKSMTEEVGMKIYVNQEACRIRQQRIDSLIKVHNEAHDSK